MTPFVTTLQPSHMLFVCVCVFLFEFFVESTQSETMSIGLWDTAGFTSPIARLGQEAR